MKFSTAFVLLSGAPAAMGFQSVGKILNLYIDAFGFVSFDSLDR